MKIRLSKNVTVEDYRRLEKAKDRDSLSQFVLDRFTERYVEPMRIDKKKKNGFTIMAVSCLMIEALESFYNGWPNSKGKSQLAFCQFFDRNPQFVFLRGHSSEFYTHVRCGILHQAETTGGWLVRRDGAVFDNKKKKLNATRFHREVESALKDYRQELLDSDWDSQIWQNFRKKMRAVCRNCEKGS